MKHVRKLSRSHFKVVAQGARSQAANMTLRPGQTSGDHGNEHPRCEQWLYVVSGEGLARVGTRGVRLAAGSLLLIERGEEHQIVGGGKEPMVTVNLYVPSAYDARGEVLPSAGGSD